ncbi:MAG TPA: iron ABC transporter permease [Mycobacteriales bacterium]|jgi:iron(III) transport system permease protein|nr:iron ABC transporter permease [Mycobacteriales bacterium]
MLPAAVVPQPAAPVRGTAAPLPLLLVVPAVVTAAVALLPLLYLAVRALQHGPAVALDVLWRHRTAVVLGRSLLLATTVTAACLVLGTALAWLTTRTDLPGRRLWAVAAALPLAVPTYVAGFAWVSFLPAAAGGVGAFAVLTLCCFPYVLLPVGAALRHVDPAQEEVARSMGLSPMRAFLRVTVPQLRPALAAGGLLVALYVLSDFGAVSVLRVDTLTRVLYTSYTSSFDRTPAAVLGLLLVAVTLVLVALEARTRRGGLPVRTSRPAAPTRLGRGRWPATAAVAAVTALAVGVPVAALAWWTAVGSSDGLDTARLLAAAGSSIGYAALGALVTTAAAVPVGVLAARRAGRLPAVLERAAYVGHALPGIVVALSMVFLAVRFTPGLYQRTPVLVLAYVVLFLPLAVGAVRSSAGQSPAALEEAARSAGARPLAVLGRVTLPLAGPGIAAGAVLVFLTCVKELPATLLLRPLGNDTLATRLWTETGVAAYADAAPYAAVLVMVAAVPAWLLSGRGRA